MRHFSALYREVQELAVMDGSQDKGKSGGVRVTLRRAFGFLFRHLFCWRMPDFHGYIQTLERTWQSVWYQAVAVVSQVVKDT